MAQFVACQHPRQLAKSIAADLKRLFPDDENVVVVISADYDHIQLWRSNGKGMPPDLLVQVSLGTIESPNPFAVPNAVLVDIWTGDDIRDAVLDLAAKYGAGSAEKEQTTEYEVGTEKRCAAEPPQRGAPKGIRSEDYRRYIDIWTVIAPTWHRTHSYERCKEKLLNSNPELLRQTKRGPARSYRTLRKIVHMGLAGTLDPALLVDLGTRT